MFFKETGFIIIYLVVNLLIVFLIFSSFTSVMIKATKRIRMVIKRIEVKEILYFLVITSVIYILVFNYINITVERLVILIATELISLLFLKYSKNLTNQYLLECDEKHVFISGVVLKLKQGVNYINAINGVASNLESPLKDGALSLSKNLLSESSTEQSMVDFLKVYNTFIFRNFVLLLKVTITNSNRNLDLMYDELLDDLRMLRHQEITLKKKVLGYRVGLRVVSLSIVATVIAIISSLNVGVFSAIGATSSFQETLFIFIALLLIVYSVIELFMDYLVRKGV